MPQSPSAGQGGAWMGDSSEKLISRELITWEVDQAGVDLVGIDLTGIDLVVLNRKRDMGPPTICLTCSSPF